MKNKNIKEIHGLTALQESMLFQNLIETNEGQYVLQFHFEMLGEIEMELFEKAFNLLTEKYEILKSNIVVLKKKGKPLTVTQKVKPLEFVTKDFTDLDNLAAKDVINECKKEDIKRGFKLETDSLIRGTLFKLSNNEYNLIISMHHVVVDGWSTSLIARDLIKYYSILLKSDLETAMYIINEEKANTLSFKEYIDWYTKQEKNEATNYWKNLLEDYEEVARMDALELKEQNTNDKNSYEKVIKLDSEIHNKIKQNLADKAITVSMFFETVLGILIQKYNNTSDVVLGKIVSGRDVDLAGIEAAVGLFINTIPTRITANTTETITTLLQKTKTQFLEGTNYHLSSLADIQNEVNHSKLFDMIFVFENYLVEKDSLDGFEDLNIKLVDSSETNNYPLALIVGIINDEITIKLSYDNEVYDENEIERFLNNYKHIIINSIENLEGTVEALDFCSLEDKELIINTFNKQENYTNKKTFVDLFEDQVKTMPNKVALVDKDKSLTYTELNELANKLAQTLIKNDIKKGETIALVLDRSFEMIISIIATMKSGAAYLPISPDLPAQRIKYIMEDSNARLLLTDKSVAIDERILVINPYDKNNYIGSCENLKIAIEINDLAYIIYTSGTTGEPKGVELEHKGIYNLMESYINDFEIKSTDKVLQFASYTFDASVSEIIMSLLIGGELHLISESEIKDINYLEKYINEKITVVTLPPAVASQITISGMNLVLTAGSEFNVDILTRFTNVKKLVNAYGPTESTVGVTYFEVTNKQKAKKISIGKPINNTQIYILNEEKLCGIGMIGELHIGGIGLARGYKNNQELTDSKFVQNIFGEGKIYKTGDLARWLPTGNIEYLGRIDDQVKIRGFRIEIGEIDNAIRAIKGIQSVATVVSNVDGEKTLCTYYVATEKLTTSEIRAHLVTALPDYMIPQYIMQIAEIPLTRNGKLAKKNLPIIEKISQNEYIEPRTEQEQKIAEVFAEILNVEKIGIDDNFFELGGHSLKATKLANRIEAETGNKIAIKDIFTMPTVRLLSESILTTKEYVGITSVEDREFFELSPTQRRMYLINSIDKTSLAYNMPLVLEITGNVNINQIEESFKQLINRHDAFRTVFEEKDNTLVQKILPNVPFKVQSEILETETINIDAKIHVIIKEFVVPFDLSSAPLLRVKIVELGLKKYLLMDMHHIISDGMSMSIIISEFMKIYSGEELAPLELQYKDYSEWLKSRDLSAQKQYWLDTLEEVEILDLPLDFKRPKVKSNRGSTFSIDLNEESVSALEVLSRKTGTTDFMILLSTLLITLNKFSNQKNIVVGTAISGRTSRETENMLGSFVNTLALKAMVEGDKQYVEFLEDVKNVALKAYENQEYPFEDLVESLDIIRDISRNPLFDVMFTLQNNENIEINIDDVSFKSLQFEDNTSKFDISITAAKVAGKYEIQCQYCPDLFTADTIKSILNTYSEILNVVINDNNILIDNIDPLLADEKKKLLTTFNSQQQEYIPSTFVEMFEEIVAKFPENKAVIFENEAMTYAELNIKANQLAKKLRAHDIKVNDVVSIVLDRSFEMIIAMIATMKAGAAYLPISDELPKDRLDYILKDSETKILIANQNSTSLDQIVWIDVNDQANYVGTGENLNRVNKVNDLAYVIYTSGTTGNPKGVEIEHFGIKNLRDVFINDFGIDNNDKILQFANYTFDASVLEIIQSLLIGGQLHLIQKDNTYNVEYLENYISDKITVALLPPILSTQMNINNMKILFSGGSEFKLEILNNCNNVEKIINAYGPTETTIVASYYDVTNHKADNKVPIGSQINNFCVYICRDNMLCGTGMIGEIYVGGVGLARGYRNHEELTNEKFIDNPFGTGRLYKTGDLGRILRDGSIEYLGRTDSQVKIRGFRIELAEIENVIKAVSGVDDAVVIVREKANQKDLNAYFVSSANVSINTVKEEIAKTLPEYMVPQYIMQIEQIPSNRSGKLDEKALPIINTKVDTKYAAPRNECETILVQVFADILDINNVGINDNFFNLGGDSIKAIRVVSKFREQGYEIKVKDVLERKTISSICEIAKVIENLKTYEQGEITGVVELTPIQKNFYQQKLAVKNHYNQCIGIKIAKNDFDLDKLKATFNALVKHHDIFRATFSGGVQTINAFAEDKFFTLNTFDYASYENVDELTETIELENSKLNASIDIEQGPLIKVNTFEFKSEIEVVIAIHHLVIDGVSWRIFIEDFENSYRNLLQNSNVPLPMKTASYLDWSNELIEYANSKEIAKEKVYWQNAVLAAKNGELSKEKFKNMSSDIEKTGYTYQTTTLSLDEKLSKSLIFDTNKKYSTEINDILLSALVMAVEKWSKKDSVSIALEGHGREDIGNSLNIDRTIGWFTSIYPVNLKCTNSIEDTIIEVKENLRRVPNKGIGYNILKFLSDDTFDASPDISFNYLGNLTNELNENMIIKSGTIPTGDSISSKNYHGYAIDIVAQITNDKFNISFTFNEQILSLEVITELTAKFEEAITSVITHCTSSENIICTPSDLKATFLKMEDYQELRTSEDLNNIEQVTPLSILQEGMLYHSITGETSEYTIQNTLDIEGSLNASALKASLQLVVNKHKALKSSIKFRKYANPIQVIYKERDVEVAYYDNQTNIQIDQLKADDLNKGFNLEQDCLIRAIIVKESATKSKFILSCHHIVVDGWSTSIVFNELIKFYNLIVKGLSIEELKKLIHSEENDSAYTEYKKWVSNKDKQDGLEYYKTYLEGYDGASAFDTMDSDVEKSASNVLLELDEVTTTKVQKLSKSLEITTSTILETTWALLLQKYNNVDDVLFGKVVSGRNVDIDGISATVGLFINTLPVRI
ncbi:MAG: amino acid adenylation domain-containing protein, partial [Mycoplasmatales bacterium]